MPSAPCSMRRLSSRLVALPRRLRSWQRTNRLGERGLFDEAVTSFASFTVTDSMTRIHRILTAFLAVTAIATTSVLHAQQRTDAPEVLFRLDDIGMNHSVNLAVEQVAK